MNKVRVRGKGQLTIPVKIRRAWGLREGSELIFIYDERKAIVKPRKKVSVREFSGALGDPAEDELIFSILDPELVQIYLEEKYGG